MARTINLVVYSNGTRPAHQAIFISTGDIGQKGKVIHVVGTTATGFFLQFKRNYDFSVEDRKYKVLPLAVVEDGVAKDTVGNGEPTEDTIARDKLESVATIVQPPGPSLKPFALGAHNCQDWMADYVDMLVHEGIFSDEAIGVVQASPKVL